MKLLFVLRKVWAQLALAFAGLLVFGIIRNSMWIEGFAPVGVIWSLGLPVLVKRTYLARLGQVIIYAPTTLWACLLLIFLFRK